MFFQKDVIHRHTRNWAKVTVTMILAVAAVWQCIGAWTDSQTTDEAVHLVAGYSYWRTNDHRINPEHPPLVKLLAAAPLLLVPNLHFSTTDPNWTSPEQWGLGFGFLYYSRLDPEAAQWILFVGRLMPVALTITLGWVLWWWVNKKWGEWPGVLATGLFVFDPTVLGHGHLVTTDMGLALTMVVTVIALERFIEQPRWRTLLWAVVAFSAAQLTKFSAVILWLVVPVLLLWAMGRTRARLSWRWALKFLVALVVMTPLLTWAVYGFEVRPFDTDPAIGVALDQSAQGQLPNDWDPPLTRWLVAHARPNTLVGGWLQSARHWPVPAYSYWQGLIDTSNHNFFGHTAFLLGDVQVHGWWYYFPVALAVKLPIITWLFIVGAGGLAAWAWWRRRTWAFHQNFWVVGWPPLLFLGWSLTSHINIGVRHVLPVMVFLYLWAAAGLALIKRQTVQRWLALSGVGVVALTSILAWPHTIGYFNGLAGGTRNAPHLLQDSNFDWNQDTWRLRRYIAQHSLTDYGVALTGGRTELWWPAARAVPDDHQIADGVRPYGTYFIVAMALFDRDNPFHWLWDKTPTEIIGTGVYRYDFR